MSRAELVQVSSWPNRVNGSGVPDANRAVRHCRSGKLWGSQYARNAGSGICKGARNCSLDKLWGSHCVQKSLLSLEVAFRIAVGRMQARSHEALLHYPPLCIAHAWNARVHFCQQRVQSKRDSSDGKRELTAPVVFSSPRGSEDEVMLLEFQARRTRQGGQQHQRVHD